MSWLESRPKYRNQKTEINSIFSDPGVVPCGVPRGSILRSLLFLIYVNDRVVAVSRQLILYADDSALLVSGRDVCLIEERLGVLNSLPSMDGWSIIGSTSIQGRQNGFFSELKVDFASIQK